MWLLACTDGGSSGLNLVLAFSCKRHGTAASVYTNPPCLAALCFPFRFPHLGLYLNLILTLTLTLTLFLNLLLTSQWPAKTMLATESRGIETTRG